jgi:hypothetical protein
VPIPFDGEAKRDGQRLPWNNRGFRRDELGFDVCGLDWGCRDARGDDDRRRDQQAACTRETRVGD